MPWAALLGILGAILANLVAPGLYLWRYRFEAVGLTGAPAAAISGLTHGCAVGLLVSGLIRTLRWLGRRPGYGL